VHAGDTTADRNKSPAFSTTLEFLVGRGTLFLDEVTEMAPETQSKLLRAVQERTVRPVGSTKETAVEVRLVASTNRDPEEAVRAGNLRQDLYYRLQAGVLNVPPLRDRAEDVPLLVEHFIEYFNEKLHPRIPVRGIEEDALTAMVEYPWPGNVRELSNCIEAAFTFGRSPMIRLQDLPGSLAGNRSNKPLLHSQTLAREPEQSIGTFAEAETRTDRTGTQEYRGQQGPSRCSA
jgi:transcriptional regulator with PAS, ATPase and Fis domain